MAKYTNTFMTEAVIIWKPWFLYDKGLRRKSMDWFLYDNGLRHEIVKNLAILTSQDFCLVIFQYYESKV